jgi:predicted enzyme related to lactoylglutathione lyase
MNYSLDHIHLRCSDLENCILYYKKMFAAKEIERGDAKGMPLVALEMAGQRFVLSPRREGVDVAVKPGEPGWGLYQIGMKVDDLDAALEELKELGAKISRGPMEVSDDLRVFFVDGPDAVEIEVMEYR